MRLSKSLSQYLCMLVASFFVVTASYAETRRYIKKVTERMTKYEAG